MTVCRWLYHLHDCVKVAISLTWLCVGGHITDMTVCRWLGKPSCCHQKTVRCWFAMPDIWITGAENTVVEEAEEGSMSPRLQLKSMLVRPRCQCHRDVVSAKMLHKLISTYNILIHCEALQVFHNVLLHCDA